MDLIIYSSEFLSESQEEINVFVSRSVKSFPAHALYTAMPQLISRITHENVSMLVVSFVRKLSSKLFFSHHIYLFYGFFSF